VKDAERYLRAALLARGEASRPDHYFGEAILLASVFAAVAGEPARGLRELERAVARYPLDSLKPLDRPYLKLAMTNAMAGRADRARVLVAQHERVVEPRLYQLGVKAEVDLTWAHIALAERRWPEAITKFRQAVNEGTPAVAALPKLGRAYELAGQTDSAIAVYERYLDTPDVVRSGEGIDAIELAGMQRRLAELYQRLGERDKAQDYYSRFIELWQDCDPELRPQVAEARRRLAMAQ
jgi:tetratricopeptide (TPR) repeat protein